MKNRTKTETVHVRITSDEQQMLQEVLEAEGFTITMWVRQQIRAAHRALFGTIRLREQKPKAQK
jgi:uncharacterized protein (DUF1778 family)